MAMEKIKTYITTYLWNHSFRFSTKYNDFADVYTTKYSSDCWILMIVSFHGHYIGSFVDVGLDIKFNGRIRRRDHLNRGLYVLTILNDLLEKDVESICLFGGCEPMCVGDYMRELVDESVTFNIEGYTAMPHNWDVIIKDRLFINSVKITGSVPESHLYMLSCSGYSNRSSIVYHKKAPDICQHYNEHMICMSYDKHENKINAVIAKRILDESMCVCSIFNCIKRHYTSSEWVTLSVPLSEFIIRK